MKGWKETIIGEISCYLNRGFSPKYVESDGDIVINQKCIRNGRIDVSLSRLTDKNKIITREKILQKEDILINSTGIGTAGRVAINRIEEKATADSHVSIVRIDKNKADPFFVFYNLRPREADIESFAEGSTGQIELGRERIKLINILLPPLPEQKAIAGVLSSLDDKIDLLHRQNKTLEAMAETLFRQWFVEEADEGIRTIVLGDIIEIYDSKRIPLSSTERDKMKNGSLFPYYGAATIMDYINDYIFDGEYLLLGEDGTVQTDEGYPVLQLAVGKYWVNNHTHVLKAKKPYSNFLLYSILKKTSVSHIVTGAVQPKINQGNLKSLELNAPCDKMIQETVLQTNNYWQKIKLNNTQIRTLEKLRDTLLPKLMSGEVRVKV